MSAGVLLHNVSMQADMIKIDQTIKLNFKEKINKQVLEKEGEKLCFVNLYKIKSNNLNKLKNNSA